jgi:hypothetical protein
MYTPKLIISLVVLAFRVSTPIPTSLPCLETLLQITFRKPCRHIAQNVWWDRLKKIFSSGTQKWHEANSRFATARMPRPFLNFRPRIRLHKLHYFHYCTRISENVQKRTISSVAFHILRKKFCLEARDSVRMERKTLVCLRSSGKSVQRNGVPWQHPSLQFTWSVKWFFTINWRYSSKMY